MFQNYTWKGPVERFVTGGSRNSYLTAIGAETEILYRPLLALATHNHAHYPAFCWFCANTYRLSAGKGVSNSLHQGLSMIGALDYYRASFIAAHSICMSTHTHTHARFVNLIKAAIKQRFICLGPNLPCRRHVTPCVAHTCHVRAFPQPPCTPLTQPISGTSTENMSAGCEWK